MLTWLPGCAYPLWPMWFSVYASCILLCSRLPQSKPLATLRRIRNTRYGWLVKPYEISILGFLPSGTFTLKEATSFACRTNASFSGYHKGRFFCSAKKMTLMVVRWKLLLGFLHYFYPYFYGNVSTKYYFLCALISSTISSKLKPSNHFPLSFV